MTPAEFRAARDSLGWTQDEAAAALGYGSAQAISDLERGKRGKDGIPRPTAILMRAYLDGRLHDWQPPA